jgi:predicted regulator of Ras-like GTPase activity (Roadblock/LC7/MglB family)
LHIKLIEEGVFTMNETPTIEMIETILKEISTAGGIEATAIASRDGLLMISTLSDQRLAERFVAMSATMMGAAETAASELRMGIPYRIIIESNNGKIIGTGAGPKALLFVMTTEDASLGLVLTEMIKASEKIKHVLGEQNDHFGL